MSEFQYYEFQALDRPLDARQQAALRAVSSRAAISSRRFTNEYHWGDFKGDPVSWMKRYFDAHVYLSNFGTRALHFRLPLALVDRDAVDAFAVKYVCETRATRTHLVFSFISDEEPGRDCDEFDEDPSAVLSRLLPVRDLLARGDLRPLYLVWLLAVQNGEIDDDTAEPPVPAGLGCGDDALTDFANFLWLDPELVEVAARGSAALAEAPPDQGLDAWVAGLPEAEKDRWLLRLVSSEGALASMEFRRTFAASARRFAAPPTEELRTAGELLAESETLAKQRREEAARKAAAERAARELKERKRRQAYLKSIKPREADLWRSVVDLTATTLQSNYDAALRKLVDLRDLAELEGESAAFSEKVEELRSIRRSKPSLIARLDRAAL